MADQLLEYGPYLLAGYLAFFMGIMSPGPNILAIIGTSMGTSRRAGLIIACGISTGSLFWAILAVLGLTALLANFAWFGSILRVIGGCYLLWLASKYIRAAWVGGEIKVTAQIVKQDDVGLYCQGIGVQLTNPKAALYWLSVMSIILRPDAPSWVAMTMIVGVGIISFVSHIAWAILFSTNRVVGFYQSFKRVFDTVIGTFFSALGLGLILSIFKSGSRV